jgi:hypothetical protein
MRAFRSLSMVTAAASATSWALRRRSVLGSALAFLRSLPARVRAGRWDDVALGLRIHAVLLSDDTTATAPIRVGAVGNHAVVLAGPSGPPAEQARAALARIPGVDDVRLEGSDPRVEPAP